MESWTKNVAEYLGKILLGILLVVAIIIGISLFLSFEFDNYWILVLAGSTIIFIIFRVWFALVEESPVWGFLVLLMIPILISLYFMGLSIDQLVSNVYIKYPILIYLGIHYLLLLVDLVKQIFK